MTEPNTFATAMLIRLSGPSMTIALVVHNVNLSGLRWICHNQSVGMMQARGYSAGRRAPTIANVGLH